MSKFDVVGRLLARYRRQRSMERFMNRTAGILATPRVEIRPGPPRIVSMVSKRHIQMYLISIKAFLARFGRGELVCIIDADTPEKDKDTLKRHLSGMRFQFLEAIDPSPCQRGGTWERLVYVLEQSQDMYTIQIDSDCLAFGDIREVSECVDANRSFALSGNGDRPILTMREWAQNARRVDSDYVGIRAERLFDRLPGCDELKYVRASSGFCGFARGGFPRERLNAFHETMASLMGGAWHEWGTEQNGSNLAIANCNNTVLLPFPKYANYTPWHDPNLSQFLHFFGTHRFLNDVFLRRSLQVIGELAGSPN